MMLVTFWFFAHHAKANCVMLPPSFSALFRDYQRPLAARAHAHFGELLDLRNLLLALLRLQLRDCVLERRRVRVEAAALGYSVVVLAGEQAAGEGRPDRCGHAAVFVQGRILLLEALAMEGIVLRLFDDGTSEAESVSDGPSFLDLLGAPCSEYQISRK
jgi:hypothetical protein